MCPGAVDGITSLDTAGLKIVRTVPIGGAPVRIVLTADGRRGYATDREARAVVPFLTDSMRVAAGTRPEGVAAPDGRHVYVTASGDDSVSVVATADTRIACRREPCAVAVAPDGSRAYVGNRVAKSVQAVDLRTNTVVGEVFLSSAVAGMALSADGKHLYAVGDESWFRLTPGPPFALTASVAAVARSARDVATNADGSRLFVADGGRTPCW